PPHRRRRPQGLPGADQPLYSPAGDGEGVSTESLGASPHVPTIAGMAAAKALSALARAVRESGLVPGGSRGVALVSGGADSAAAAAGLVEVAGPEAVTALHLNYGL